MEYFIAFPLGNCVYILYTKIAQDVYNWCIQNVYKMYNIFQQTFVYILYTTSKKLHQRNIVYKMYTKVCWHVVYILYTKVCQNMGYILYTNILYTLCIQNVYKFVKMRNSFCIHFVYISSDLLKAYIINMYTICIQNPYKMHIQIIVCRMDPLFQHILTHLLCISKKKPPNLCSWLATQTLCGLNGLSDCMNLLTTFRRV